jgi:hypothetical protein
MCPICFLLGWGGVALLLGPATTMTLAHWARRPKRLPLPMSFMATDVRNARQGWQSPPPIVHKLAR